MSAKPIRGIAFALMLGALSTAAPVADAQEQAPAADQQQQASSQDAQAPQPLSDEEMQVLVARVALYPDELVAAITAASLYPLQIVEAERFLVKSKSDKNLKPKSDWNGSVVSLLNYPEIVKMMSDDLDWTQQLGQAITYQEKEVLAAIQQLRQQAVAKGVIKTNDKVKVVKQQDNIVIQPANAEKIYIPQYPPQMLYEPDYAVAPVAYYPTPYLPYYYPTATFFAGVVTGAVWAGVIDWNNRGIWGGRWNNNININCNNCFNNRKFSGNVKWNDIDWKHVDRSKISFNKADFNKIDRTSLKTDLERNNRNKLSNRGNELNRQRFNASRGTKNGQVRDVRKSTLEGLKQKPASLDKAKRPARSDLQNRATRQTSKGSRNKIDRQVGKPRAGTRVDNRPRNPSGLGDVRSFERSRMNSNRGNRSMNRAVNRGNVRPRMSGGRGRRR